MPYVSLKLYSYLRNRWHRTKINQKFSSWKQLSQGVPQGSVLGSLLLIIYFNDLFFLNMKLKQDKCHLLISGHKNENVCANIGKEKIWESNKQKLIGSDIDRNLNFNENVSSLCRKAGNKLSVLPRLSNFMSFKQRRTLLKTFIESQFGYCPYGCSVAEE